LPPRSSAMASSRQQALAEFRRVMKWIALVAVLMVVGALTYLYFYSTLDVSTVVAVTLGVFLSVVLGCGLFAAAFFSANSGHDQEVSDVTKSERDRH
jgi:predicted Na+-dependent transporter